MQKEKQYTNPKENQENHKIENKSTKRNKYKKNIIKHISINYKIKIVASNNEITYCTEPAYNYIIINK
jgi:hypothetical protein